MSKSHWILQMYERTGMWVYHMDPRWQCKCITTAIRWDISQHDKQSNLCWNWICHYLDMLHSSHGLECNFSTESSVLVEDILSLLFTCSTRRTFLFCLLFCKLLLTHYLSISANQKICSLLSAKMKKSRFHAIVWSPKEKVQTFIYEYVYNECF